MATSPDTAAPVCTRCISIGSSYLPIHHVPTHVPSRTRGSGISAAAALAIVRTVMSARATVRVVIGSPPCRRYQWPGSRVPATAIVADCRDGAKSLTAEYLPADCHARSARAPVAIARAGGASVVAVARANRTWMPYQADDGPSDSIRASPPFTDTVNGRDDPWRKGGGGGFADRYRPRTQRRGGHMMPSNLRGLFRRSTVLGLAAAAGLLLCAPPTHARVSRIIVDTKTSPAFGGQSYGAAGQYETLAGRAFGELDPSDPHNAIIQDIQLAPRNAHGNVEYMATFFIVKPIDMSKSSHLMWHDVPNRGGRLTIVEASRIDGDVGLSSGWQGDSSGATAPAGNNDYVVVPVAKNPDGSPITGLVMGRILNVSGVNSQPMIVHSNPVPYRPMTLDTTQATLTTHSSESIDGDIGKTAKVRPADWAWARCSATNPFPGTPDPTQICVKGGFDPLLLYQVVFTAKDPYVLGAGFAAFRDVASFFKNQLQDDVGTKNPLANQISWVIGRGVSQSGNFMRAFLHLGFNQDEAGRQVYESAWPIIAGRRVALNFRFAMPDGVLKLYEPGSEGPQWWVPWPDPVRNLPTRVILGRCTESHTCPKIIEHFGAAEVWGLKLTPEWVGTKADANIPLTDNIRRYYIPSTQHGGGNGGFNVNPAPPPSCPSANYGQGTFAANPVPHTETVNAIRFHFRNW